MRSYVYSHEEKDQVNTEESIEPEEFEEFHIEENVSLTFNLKGIIIIEVYEHKGPLRPNYPSNFL